jgi:hypothetical protein
MAQLVIWVSIVGVCVRTSLLAEWRAFRNVNDPGMAFESARPLFAPLNCEAGA